MDSSRNDLTPTQILTGTPAPLALALDADAKKHFDTFETHFFQQGDQVGLPGTDDTYDERPSRIARWLPYRTLMAITIASTTVAVVACIALWQSRAPAPTPPMLVPVAATTPTAAVAPTAPAPEPSAVPAPSPAMAVAPAAAPVAPSVPAQGFAEPTPAPAAPSVPAQEPAALAATAPVPAALAATAPAPVEEPAVPPAPAPAKAVVAAEAALQAASDTPAVAPAPAVENEAREPCRAALRGHKAKEIVAACSAAFDADASFAEAAVAVAKVEFDRGRFTQAYAWSKKALAADPANADAYVYAGGAEQSRGHAKAAKESYLQYLRLAPSGRYASEVRAIVKSL